MSLSRAWEISENRAEHSLVSSQPTQESSRQLIIYCHTANAPKVNQASTDNTTKTHTHTPTGELAWCSRTQKRWEGRGFNRQH